MSPFIGNPIGFSPATLALLDAALTDMCADFERVNAKAQAPIAKPVAAPVVSEIDITPTAGDLRFNNAHGWYLR